MNEYQMTGHDGLTLGSSVAAWFLCLFFTMAFVGLRSAAERRALLGLAVGAYVLKSTLAVIYFYVLVKEGFNGFAGIDPVNYHRWGMEMARDIKSGISHFSMGWHAVDPGYPYLCARLYLIFGDNTLAPRFLNCAVSSAGTIYIYRIASHFFGKATAQTATLIYLFLPFSILIALDQRKDPVITFLALGLLWHAVRLTQVPVGKWASSAVGVVLLFFMHYMRSAFIWPFFGILIIAFAVFSRNVLTSIAGVLLSIIIVVSAQLLLPEDNPNTLEHSTERFEGKLQHSEQVSRYEGGLLRFARVTSVFDLWKTPIAAVCVLLIPFPPLFSFEHVPAALSSWANLFVVALFPALFWGIYLVLRNGGWKKHLLLWIYPLVFVALIGILHPDVTRYRETAFPAVLLLMSRGLKAGTPAVVTIPIYAVLALTAALVYLSRAGQI